MAFAGTHDCTCANGWTGCGWESPNWKTATKITDFCPGASLSTGSGFGSVVPAVLEATMNITCPTGYTFTSALPSCTAGSNQGPGQGVWTTDPTALSCSAKSAYCAEVALANGAVSTADMAATNVAPACDLGYASTTTYACLAGTARSGKDTVVGIYPTHPHATRIRISPHFSFSRHF